MAWPVVLIRLGPLLIRCGPKLAKMLRWSFSGTRLAAGGTAAGVNIAQQIYNYQGDWKQYNWGSIGYDYAMGALGYHVSKAVFMRWPAPLFSKKVRDLTSWVNLGKQQAALILYQTLMGALTAMYSNTPQGKTIFAAHAASIMPMIQSVALQSFLASATGQKHFPLGWADPRVVYLRGVVSFLCRMAIREVLDVVPQNNPDTVSATPVPAGA